MPTRPVVWIENDVVKNLNYDRYRAQKEGKEPTGAAGGFGGGALKMSGGTETLESLIAGCQRGLLVTRLWDIRGVDPRTILFTDLTRDGTFRVSALHAEQRGGDGAAGAGELERERECWVERGGAADPVPGFQLHEFVGGGVAPKFLLPRAPRSGALHRGGGGAVRCE
jgi:hypothetical protein